MYVFQVYFKFQESLDSVLCFPPTPTSPERTVGTYLPTDFKTPKLDLCKLSLLGHKVITFQGWKGPQVFCAELPCYRGQH